MRLQGLEGKQKRLLFNSHRVLINCKIKNLQIIITFCIKFIIDLDHKKYGFTQFFQKLFLRKGVLFKFPTGLRGPQNARESK